jgi:hypothetical protein
MAREIRYECPHCYGLIGWVGERARRDPMRKHLACTCDEAASAKEALLELTVKTLAGKRAA